MASKLVVNASPIILLAKIDGLQLLRSLCEEVLIPRAVIEEVLAGDTLEAALEGIEDRDWVTVIWATHLYSSGG